LLLRFGWDFFHISSLPRRGCFELLLDEGFVKPCFVSINCSTGTIIASTSLLCFQDNFWSGRTLQASVGYRLGPNKTREFKLQGGKCKYREWATLSGTYLIWKPDPASFDPFSPTVAPRKFPVLPSRLLISGIPQNQRYSIPRAWERPCQCNVRE